MPLTPVTVVGALYTASERGLAADVLAARALGLAPLPLCTSLVVASGGRVTDVTDVPVDTVEAQLEHLTEAGPILGVKLGVLGGAKTVEAVLGWAGEMEAPVVMDVVASGPSGETVLTSGGVDAVASRLGVADVVTASRADAELMTGGQIESLDDAQVAAQRIHHRGARRVLIRCGSLPYRFYDAASDPGHETEALNADLYFDGEDFALFEAPQMGESPDGASSVLALSLLRGLIEGRPIEESLQRAKRDATEAVRHRLEVEGHPSRTDPYWASEA